MIEPIVVRPHGERYQLIAGERRWRAIRDHTDMEKVQAQVVMADDLRVRRMAAAENLQREDLSAIETIETIVEIVDAELIEDAGYAAMGKTPVDRVKILLGKLDSIRRSEQGGYEISDKAKTTSHNFMGSVQDIFKKLLNPLEWRPFYTNGLPLIMDICKESRTPRFGIT